MKFRVLLSNLKKQLDEVAGIAGTAPNKEDITQNILINVSENSLNLKATNYNLELKTIIPLDDVESEGEITVNANKLRDTLSNLDINSVVSITLDEDKNVLVISDGNTSFEIRTRSSIDFPSFELEDIEQEISIKQCLLKSIIDSSVFCVSNEDFRDYLKGIRFELNGSKLEIFTSDGHRMAILETQLANQSSSGSFAISSRILGSLSINLAAILSYTKEGSLTMDFWKEFSGETLV